MNELPYIGASLTEGLMPLGRRTWKQAPECPRCHEPCYPRGRDNPTALCWFCRFPRRTPVARTAA